MKKCLNCVHGNSLDCDLGYYQAYRLNGSICNKYKEKNLKIEDVYTKN